MSIVVFYLEATPTDAGDEGFLAQFIAFRDDEMGSALKQCEELRKRSDISHVTLSTELKGMVGKPGVDSVVDGRTPDGHPYDWSKADRAGKMRKSDLVKTITRSD